MQLDICLITLLFYILKGTKHLFLIKINAKIFLCPVRNIFTLFYFCKLGCVDKMHIFSL